MLKGRQDWTALFEAERTEILRLARSVAELTGEKQVLVKRIRGMEDSSRFWSVYMVLDHLNIVNTLFTSIMFALTRGTVPDGKASTADVKPSPDANGALVDEFERTCAKYVSRVGKLSDLKTKVRYAHPWFGPLDAAGWHALAAFHMALHRQQIERILRGHSTLNPE